MLRSLPGELAGEGWPGQLLEQLGALHLLVQAHRRIDELPPDLAATVRSRVGYPVRKADVLAGPGVRTTGSRSGGGQPRLPVGDPPGLAVRQDHPAVGAAAQLRPAGRISRRLGPRRPSTACGAALLPGLRPVPRAGRRAAGRPRAAPHRPQPEAYGELLDRFATLLADDPWASRMPAVILAAAIPPDRPEGNRGGCGRRRGVPGGDRGPGEPWPLLARSLAAPTPIFGEWDPPGFRPLSLLPDGHGPRSAPTSSDRRPDRGGLGRPGHGRAARAPTADRADRPPPWSGPAASRRSPPRHGAGRAARHRSGRLCRSPAPAVPPPAIRPRGRRAQTAESSAIWRTRWPSRVDRSGSTEALAETVELGRIAPEHWSDAATLAAGSPGRPGSARRRPRRARDLVRRPQPGVGPAGRRRCGRRLSERPVNALPRSQRPTSSGRTRSTRSPPSSRPWPRRTTGRGRRAGGSRPGPSCTTCSAARCRTAP